jgi:dihydrofolate reductase
MNLPPDPSANPRRPAARKLGAFTQLSLDGYFCDEHGDMSWAHQHDAEWNDFAAGNAQGGGAMLFGRITYEMMASFWPTPAGAQVNAKVAEHMNRMPKYVVSRSLKSAPWQNTQLLGGDLVEEVRRLKDTPGPDLVILGSGSVVAQLTGARLVDEYQLVVNPIVLGKGRTPFAGVKDRAQLTLQKTRAFSNGNVVLWYARAG